MSSEVAVGELRQAPRCARPERRVDLGLLLNQTRSVPATSTASRSPAGLPESFHQPVESAGQTCRLLSGDLVIGPQGDRPGRTLREAASHAVPTLDARWRRVEL